MHTMMAATDTVPLNLLFTGKGNDSGPAGLVDQIRFGAAGLKLHEVHSDLHADLGKNLMRACAQDWGTTPATIDTALKVGDEYDVQINIHTDTLNESGFVEDTIAAFGGRTIHTYHTEGAGYAGSSRLFAETAELTSTRAEVDTLRILSSSRVMKMSFLVLLILLALTVPIRSTSTSMWVSTSLSLEGDLALIVRLLQMLMVCHHLDRSIRKSCCF